ncbi:MAG: hypothetical protein S0880_07580 [Actinomycetota bacterium]|nr:hypothetical protein [Actinomycetota bacterium]
MSDTRNPDVQEPDPDLAAQLAAYGRWLESENDLELISPSTAGSSTLVDLRGTAADASDADVTEMNGIVERSSRRTWALVAAVVVLVVGSIGYGFAQRGGEGDEDVVAGPSDERAEPVYLLPAEGTAGDGAGAGEPRNAYRGTPGPLPVEEPLDERGLVIGRPDGDGYTDVVSVTVSEPSDVVPLAPIAEGAEDPADEVRAEWTTEELGSGEVLVATGTSGMFTTMAAQRNGRWLEASVSVDRSSLLDEVFEDLTVDEDGAAELTGSDLEVVDDFGLDFFPSLVVVESNFTRAFINTWTPVPTLLLMVDSSTTGIEPRTVDGADGWALRREGGFDVLVWEVAPDTMASVASTVSDDDLVEIAESLEIVDAATWEAAFPELTDALTSESSDGEDPVTSAEDPSEPLYVLPADGFADDTGLGSVELMNGHRMRLDPSTTELPPERIVVVGKPDGDGYTGLLSVTVSRPSDLDAPPDPFADAPAPRGGERDEVPWTPMTLDGGEVLTAEFGDLSWIADKRSGRWLTSFAATEHLTALTEVFEDLTVDEDGTAQLDDSSELQVVEEVAVDEVLPALFAGFEIGGSGRSLSVETVTPAISMAAFVSGYVERAVPGVDGLGEGWTFTREDSPGREWNSVAWQLTPNALVSVSGEAPIDELIAIAEPLEIVDEATWEAEFPNAAEIATGGSTGGPLVTSSEDPAGPLYVLAGEGSDVVLTGGFRNVVESPAQEPRPVRLVTVGRPDDGGFEDLITVRIGEPSEAVPEVPGAPWLDTADGWSTSRLSSGDVLVAEGSEATAMAARREGRWIEAQAPSDRVAALVELFEDAIVEDGGSLRLAAGSGLSIVEQVPIDDGTSLSTSAEVAGASGSIAVETASSPSLLVGAGMVERIQPLAVGNAWTTTRSDPEGDWNGIVWQATPATAVAVSGHVPPEEVRAVAQSLEIVDEATWEAAFPDAPELADE